MTFKSLALKKFTIGRMNSPPAKDCDDKESICARAIEYKAALPFVTNILVKFSISIFSPTKKPSNNIEISNFLSLFPVTRASTLDVYKRQCKYQANKHCAENRETLLFILNT